MPTQAQEKARLLKEKATKEKAANYYLEGVENEKIDMPLAVVMYRKAAVLDHPRAAARLACLLWCGSGDGAVRQDKEEALKWTAEALKHDNTKRLPPAMSLYLKHFQRLREDEIRADVVEEGKHAFAEAVAEAQAIVDAEALAAGASTAEASAARRASSLGPNPFMVRTSQEYVAPSSQALVVSRPLLLAPAPPLPPAAPGGRSPPPPTPPPPGRAPPAATTTTGPSPRTATNRFGAPRKIAATPSASHNTGTSGSGSPRKLPPPGSRPAPPSKPGTAK